MSARTEAIALYRSLVRSSKQFATYNFREYFLRRTRYARPSRRRRLCWASSRPVAPPQRGGVRAGVRGGARAYGRAPYSLHSRADSVRALLANPLGGCPPGLRQLLTVTARPRGPAPGVSSFFYPSFPLTPSLTHLSYPLPRTHHAHAPRRPAAPRPSPPQGTGPDVCAALSVVRRGREDFRQHKSITDPAKIQDMLEYGRKELTVIQRQAAISNLYSPSRSVLENRKARADSR
jgi:hypothetical protein